MTETVVNKGQFSTLRIFPSTGKLSQHYKTFKKKDEWIFNESASWADSVSVCLSVTCPRLKIPLLVDWRLC